MYCEDTVHRGEKRQIDRIDRINRIDLNEQRHENTRASASECVHTHTHCGKGLCISRSGMIMGHLHFLPSSPFKKL